jgi:menaquinone-dependent protoporphyrinogen oxidase
VTGARPIRVLLAAASKHGGTWEITESIGRTLRDNGLDVDLVRLAAHPGRTDRPDPADYAAVVLGSAVYGGKWLAPAREFIAEELAALNSRPVWAFSSGPIGSPSGPETADVSHVLGIVGAANPVEHRVFGGRLDHRELGLAERIMVRAVRAPDSDDRDWDVISAWAVEIARALAARPTALA